MPNRRDEPPRSTERPEPGFYSARLVRRGPQAACRIVHEPEGWLLMINREPTSAAFLADPWKVPRMESVAMYGKVITGPEYTALLDQIERSPAGSPLRKPFEAVDLRAAAPLHTKGQR